MSLDGVQRVEGLDFADYVLLDREHVTRLKALQVSPLNYLSRQHSPMADTDGLRVGRAVHSATLEPHKFTEQCVVWPKRRQGKAWENFRDTCPAHQTILTQSQYDDTMRMRDAVYSHPVAAELLSEGQPEVTYLWEHPIGGTPCKSRVDYDGDTVLVDLKTTASETPEQFGRDAANFGYHLQAAFYQDAVEAVTGLLKRVAFVCVQKRAPFDVWCLRVTEEQLAQGRAVYEDLLTTRLTCIENDDWPGQAPDELIDMVLPAYAMPTAPVVLQIGGQSVSLGG